MDKDFKNGEGDNEINIFKYDEITKDYPIIYRFKEKIGEDVLTRAKNALVGKYALSKQSLSARSQSMALNFLYGLGERYDDENIEKIKRLTPQDLRKCCQKYFDTSSKVTVQVIPNNK